MTLLLDTHVLLWVLLEPQRMRRYRWVERYVPWGVSPFSLLEVQILVDRGRIDLEMRPLIEELAGDERFVIDDVSSLALVRQAIDVAWTRDPFDRLLAAHSLARQVPLCTTDQMILDNHTLLPRELR